MEVLSPIKTHTYIFIPNTKVRSRNNWNNSMGGFTHDVEFVLAGLRYNLVEETYEQIQGNCASDARATSRLTV